MAQQLQHHTIKDILANPTHDWAYYPPNRSGVTLFFRPTISGQALSNFTLPVQPMYPLRKLIARAEHTRTQALPTELLNALLNIEQGVGQYLFAVETGFDAVYLAQMWGKPYNKRGTTLHEHKMRQLLEVFPEGTASAEVDILHTVTNLTLSMSLKVWNFRVSKESSSSL